MSILPMKRCKKCDYIFPSPTFGRKITCPRCGGGSLTDASATDIAHDKKMKAQAQEEK